jgi:C1A family cysteine protease
MAICGFFRRSVHTNNTRRIHLILIKPVLGLLLGAIISNPVFTADLTTPEAQAQLDRTLTQEGINYTVMHEGLDSQRIIMSGSSNLDSLRKSLYSLPTQQGFLRASTTITVSGHISKDKTVQMLLESNPSTGYSWELVESANNAVHQEGDSTYESRGLLGGTAKQMIEVKANKEGFAEVKLIYKRPWEQDSAMAQAMAASAPNKITIQLDKIPDVIDLSDPNAEEQTIPEDGHKKLYKEETESMLPTATLPAAWDWRTSGAGLTPVRDQGNCGSCWAFATVGVLESAFRVKMGIDINASEQFLVSCNNAKTDYYYPSNWGCNGGWYAHDYHSKTLGALQSVIGSVAEADMVYTASNGTCKTVSNHPHRISSWNYIAGKTVPSVEQIKSAIYNYGPVAASICASTAFNSYRSGVFSTNESAACGGTNKSNHAIVLVGWDDATQSWILRNSWGSAWGEQGYMRIKYGTSNVGYSANYVVLAQGTNQTISAITFTPATLTLGGTTTASATATSKLAVSFSSKTATVCTVSGSTVKAVTAGVCTIAADQPGNTTYNAAPQVIQNLTVGKINQTISAITFTPATLTVSGSATIKATATSKLAVSFSSKTAAVCTVSGSAVKAVTAGVCTIAADQPGNATYNAAPPVTQNLTVGKVSQTIGPITFTPATLTVGATTTASAAATSKLAVSFSSKTAAVCTVSGSAVKAVTAGVCTIAADQPGNATYNAAPPVTQNLTVGKASQTIGSITFTPATLTVGATTTASAAATSKLAVSFSSKTAAVCTVSGSAVKAVTAGVCTIAADQPGNATYNAAPPVTQNLTVGKVSQTIGPITFTPATLTVSGTTRAVATATSKLAVSFSSKTAAVCTVSGSTVKAVTAGVCTIAANQAGNTTYNAAPPVTHNLTVGKVSQTIGPITFTPATLTVGGTTTVSAAATSKLAVSFSSKTAAVCTVSGSAVKAVTAGVCTIAADQPGNATYNAAPPVTQNLTVGKASQTIGSITFTPATLTVGGTTTVSAAATSKLAVSFSSKTAAVCTVSGSAVKAVTAGVCTIAADQPGNATYNAAPQVTQNLTVGKI